MSPWFSSLDYADVNKEHGFKRILLIRTAKKQYMGIKENIAKLSAISNWCLEDNK